MISIDIGNTEVTLQEVVVLASVEPVRLVKDGAALAVVVSIVEYKQIQKLKAELARSISENS